jgi:hypothetical protein
MVEHGLDGERVEVEACQCLRSGAGWKGQGRQRRSVEGKGRRGRVAQGARRRAKGERRKTRGERLGVGDWRVARGARASKSRARAKQEQSKSKRAGTGRAGLVVLTPEGGLAAGMGEGAAGQQGSSASREGPRWNRAHSGSGCWDSGFLGAASNRVTGPGQALRRSPLGWGALKPTDQRLQQPASP